MSSAQPGWYPAGVPGRERWWDGTQWTAHERDAAVQPPAAPATLAAQHPGAQHTNPPQASGQYGYAPTPRTSGQYGVAQQYGAGQPTGPAMGWYVFPKSGQPRWWNANHWTAYYVRNGRPAVNGYATDPPSTGWVLGGLMLFLGLVNFLRALADDLSGISMAFIFTVLGILWLIGTGADQARRKVPAPNTAPIVEDWMRPFPGEAESASAGWYPVAGAIQRWWTGARWAEYVSDKGRVRPTQYGLRAYRLAMIVAAVFGGLGAIGLVIGIVLMTAGEFDGGLALIIIGGTLLLVAGVVWLSVYVRRYALIIPPHPPKQLG